MKGSNRVRMSERRRRIDGDGMLGVLIDGFIFIIKSYFLKQ